MIEYVKAELDKAEKMARQRPNSLLIDYYLGQIDAYRKIYNELKKRNR